MPDGADRWGITYRIWAICHAVLTLLGASGYVFVICYAYINSIQNHDQLVSSSEKVVLIATGLVYSSLAIVALIGLFGCHKRSSAWLGVYEKFSWAFFAAQIGVTGWFIYAVFLDRKGLLWRCKHTFGGTAGASSMKPEYESLDPAKACRLLEKWGPLGAILGCLVILAQELDGCYVLREYLKDLRRRDSATPEGPTVPYTGVVFAPTFPTSTYSPHDSYYWRNSTYSVKPNYPVGQNRLSYAGQ
ncbi:hypothetical protein BDV93DRAFT_583991 [Ceratobasidium sp. AG-I]|nr:hypothetical protein BDV93DRAFT_583991 [Ceratobasidium sp. AG-I]